MKNLLNTLTFAFLMFTSLSSFAKPGNPFKNATTTTLIDSYIQATSLGDTKYSEYLFAEDFKHIQSSNKKTKQYNKKQILTFLKKQEGYIMNCEASHKIIEQNSSYSIAKVKMVFPNFTRIDYVTLSNQDDAWVITQVATSYENSKL